MSSCGCSKKPVCRRPISYFPLFSEFGKSTKDFFAKGFQTNVFRVGIRDQMNKYIHGTINGSHDTEKLEANGDFQVRLTCPFLPGYSNTTKWNTANLVTSDILANETFLPGLDVCLGAEYDVDKSSILGKLRSSYKHEYVTVEGSFKGGDPESNPMFVGANFVSGYQDVAVGANIDYNITDNETKKYNIAASFVHAPVKLFATMENAEVIWGGLVYKHNDRLELGLSGTYKSDPEAYYNIGGTVKYAMDCCTAVKAKVDTDRIVNLGVEVKLKHPATVTMSTKFDGDKWNEGGHEVGIGLDFEI